MRITIKDIAKKANVSIATVSRVINHKKGIGKETRKRVWSIIEKMNYQPSVTARSMITNKTLTIGLIIPDIRNPFFPELVRGIEDHLHKNGYNVFLCNTDENPAREKKYFKVMQEKNVDGIIYTNSYSETRKGINDFILQNKIPIVFLDRGLKGKHLNGVFIDNIKGGYIATQHLIELSHEKIGCITGPVKLENSEDRKRGYISALKENGLEVNHDLIQPGHYQIEGGYKAAKKLLLNHDITAIFALNDLMAFGVYQAAAELNKRIPRDLSVIGFDDITYNKLLYPKLTTINQPNYEMGNAAADLLLNKIEKGDGIEGKIIHYTPKLVVRDSTQKLTL